ncbi:MAG: carbamoyltransferase HypF, partial [Phycisphaerae bacterium]|nr:carbamoyltransferase HypF [Phycisphaerae bacterium]
VPYDREKTSMNAFEPCPACLAEYTSSGDRRFHAQTNCCWDCGPKLSLYDNRRNSIRAQDPIQDIRRFLKAGKIVAIKGLGGFHLACDATNASAVAELRRRKGRGRKPFALMVASLEQARQICRVDDRQAQLLNDPASPIVLLQRLLDSPVSDQVAPNNNYLGLMLPYTAIHHLLLPDSPPLVMTSGNIAEEAIIADNEQAFAKLSTIADYFLSHDRAIRYRCDDSVARIIDGQTQLLRRSRGYTPQLIPLPANFPSVLAVGGQMKNTICFLKADKALLSQHLGDMDNPQAYEFFQQTLEHLGDLLSFEPAAVAHDLHPHYQTTNFAQAMSAPRKIPIQHHEAHIAGCLAEHQALNEQIIGLSFDGSGFGPDNCVWGGEVFVGRLPNLRRVAHFDYLPMPGSELAVKEPWRMAVSYLKKTFGPEYRKLPLPMLEEFSSKLPGIDKLIDSRINSPLTSSCGRLFDAVSSLLGLCHFNTFEGEAAVTLEMAMTDCDWRPYPYTLPRDDRDCYLPDFTPTIKAIVDDLTGGVAHGLIAARFHHTIIQLCLDLVSALAADTGITKVVITGGVFQNNFLHSRLKRLLAQAGFDVYANTLTPPNDGGIALGQAVLAGMILQGEDHK